MGEMVERVAQAILNAEHASGAETLDELIRVARVQARAAIAAMREPTFQMMMVETGGCTDGVWEAQIDEALKS